jgi:general secretion pathway protein D
MKSSVKTRIRHALFSLAVSTPPAIIVPTIANVTIALSVPLLISPAAWADNASTAPENRVTFTFDNAPLADVVKTYIKLSGRKLIMATELGGRATILNHQPVSLDEAFRGLATALALNGFTYYENDGVLVIEASRNASRSGIPVVTELPATSPERLFTYVRRLKHVSVEEINKKLRILPSKDGEMTPDSATNSLVLTDYLTNLRRIDRLLSELDVPARKASKTAAPRGKTSGVGQ